jgi:hypothetical protein
MAAAFAHAWGIQTLIKNIWYQKVLMVFKNLLTGFSIFAAAVTGIEQYIADPVNPLHSIQIDPFSICTSFRVRAILTAVNVSLNLVRD